MRSILPLLDRLLRGGLMLLMGTMVLAVSWQVVSRYLLASPSPWTEEVARYLLIWIGMLGAAYAFRTRMHIGLDLLPRRLSGLRAQALHWLTLGIIIVFATTVLILGGGKLMLLTWELRQTSAALELPVSLVYSVMPLTGCLIVIYAIAGFAATPGPDAAGEVD